MLVAEELGFSTRQLRRWRDEASQHGEDAFPGRGRWLARCYSIMLDDIYFDHFAGGHKPPTSADFGPVGGKHEDNSDEEHDLPVV